MRSEEFGAFLLRIVTGFIFFAHGWVKWQRGLEAAADSFAAMGLPGWLAYIVTIVELAGGWAMMLGLGTRLMAAAFAVIMVGAIAAVKADAGLLGNGRETGYEFNLALLAMSMYLWLNGSRLWSLDSVVRRPRG
ncbi:oxidoreductase [Geobacillus subterraneus]|uniref:Oxidoreductase n=2 Tax=Geobacillus TaxID=129337 RepID=A0ABM6AEM1_9BACL|nr:MULTISPECIES: DoxX family protein [Geobacillus]AMX84777.1 oxidoreductase [Geobacillus subterraneus]KZS25390.1 oxidoreductase [Geobacillus subterraneus]OXB85601.1 oxidoreductase [Geobacillus uzenensis]QIZ66396.1 DoxX family protein [Geobacillus subterraneus]WPZ18601.1 DoxX family protein [Geobacillus subterraneus]